MADRPWLVRLAVPLLVMLAVLVDPWLLLPVAAAVFVFVPLEDDVEGFVLVGSGLLMGAWAYAGAVLIGRHPGSHAVEVVWLAEPVVFALVVLLMDRYRPSE